MSTNYPSSIDSFPTPGATLASNPHSSLHQSVNDAVTALETKVGVDGSAVTTTIDYKLKNTASISPGHKHVTADITDAGSFIPTGEIIFYAGSSTPTGFLPANGNAVSRSTYASLFSLIGTTYGAGDGSTTFNVPTFSPVYTGNPAYDASSSHSAGASSNTVAHTVGAANALLVVAVYNESAGAVSISSVTYNGVNMTSADSTTFSSGGIRLALYYLANPSTGTNNIVATFSGSCNNQILGVSYIPIQTSSTLDVHGTATITSATTISIACTPTVADLVVACASGQTGFGNMICGAPRKTISAFTPTVIGDILFNQSATTFTFTGSGAGAAVIAGFKLITGNSPVYSLPYIKT